MSSVEIKLDSNTYHVLNNIGPDVDEIVIKDDENWVSVILPA